MIHDVDASLRALMERDALNGSGVDVSFEAPTRDWAAKRQRPTISLFLYDVREDVDRRLAQPVDVTDERGIVTGRAAPPRFFKLSYLVTAWTKRPEDEHRLLSTCLGVVLQTELLPKEVLVDPLRDYARHIRMSIGMPPPQDRSLSDVWSALGGELKPSLDLVVTAPFDLSRVDEAGPPVTDGVKLMALAADGPAADVRADREAGLEGEWSEERLALTFAEDGSPRPVRSSD